MNHSTLRRSSGPAGRPVLRRGLAVLAGVAACSLASGQIVDPLFAGSYTATSLGGITGLPGPYGGLTLLAGNNNTLLIGGRANNAAGAIYSVGLVRDGLGHITGFSGAATFVADAPHIDGGLAYAPNGTLFFTGYPVNTLGQLLPGSSTPDATTSLAGLGVVGSVGSFAFVPGTHPGGGQAKAVTYNGGNWYTLGMTLNGDGTYAVTSATAGPSGLFGGPEGIAYVPIGSTLFANPSVLIAEWAAGTVGAYDVDANGDPIAASRRTFMSSLSGAEGAFIDPVTGDFLFSTWGNGQDYVVRVSGFATPPPPTGNTVPDAASTGALVLGVLGAIVALRRRMT